MKLLELVLGVVVKFFNTNEIIYELQEIAPMVHFPIARHISSNATISKDERDLVAIRDLMLANCFAIPKMANQVTILRNYCTKKSLMVVTRLGMSENEALNNQFLKASSMSAIG